LLTGCVDYVTGGEKCIRAVFFVKEKSDRDNAKQEKKKQGMFLKC
jgi:hypothetical protein